MKKNIHNEIKYQSLEQMLEKRLGLFCATFTGIVYGFFTALVSPQSLHELKYAGKNIHRAGLLIILVVAMNVQGVIAIGETLAYYNDVETSSGNVHSASSLDFSLDAGDWDPLADAGALAPEGSVSRDVAVLNDGVLDFQYTVRTEETGGDSSFCAALDLKVTVESTSVYSGDLLSFISSTEEFPLSDDWEFEVALPSGDPPAGGGFESAETCEFDFVYEGWQLGFASYPEGFSDEERVSNSITAHEEVFEIPEANMCTLPTAEHLDGFDTAFPEFDPPAGGCGDDPETVVIDSVITGTDFDYDGNVVIASGGALELSGGATLTVNVACDLIIETGGEIRANDATNAGDIVVTVGGNLSVAGDSIEAKSSDTGSINNGGNITIAVQHDFDLTGSINSYGQENAGGIFIQVGDDFYVTSSGKVYARSGTSGGINSGGDIHIEVNGGFYLAGYVDSFGQEESGGIEIDVDGVFGETATGEVSSGTGSSGSSNTGGSLQMDVEGMVTIGGLITTKAQETSGLLTIDSGGDLLITSTGEVNSGSGSSGSSNSGGDLVFFGDTIDVYGLVKSKGQEQGGDIQIIASDFLTIYGSVDVLAESDNSGSINNGGNIVIAAPETISISGKVSTFGQENAGCIGITTGDDFVLESVGELHAKSGDSGSTNKGGAIYITAENDATIAGDVDVYGQEIGGTITLTAGGITTVSGNSLKANSGSSGSHNRGGIIKVTSAGSLTVSGNIEANGDEQADNTTIVDIAGIIELITLKAFTLTSSGVIEANSGDSGSINVGGNISIVAREGDSTIAGEISAEGQERGGRVAVTINGALTVSGYISTASGSSGSINKGGGVRLTTPSHLEVSSMIDSSGSDVDGVNETFYCTNDFTGATFDLVAIETTNCTTVILNEFVPNPAGGDDAAAPGGEWVELYNYGTSNVDVAGWYLYDSYDAHELAITAANTFSGDTIVPAGGFLVVYRDGDGDFALNNSGGDTLRLFDGDINVAGIIRDFVTYVASAASGKSFARVPDGGVWYDPEPSPGETNEVTFDYFADFFALYEDGNPENDVTLLPQDIEETESAQETTFVTEPEQTPVTGGGGGLPAQTSVAAPDTEEPVEEENTESIEEGGMGTTTPEVVVEEEILVVEELAAIEEPVVIEEVVVAPILPTTELGQNRESSISQPNQDDLVEIGKESAIIEEPVIVEDPIIVEEEIIPEPDPTN
jgi:hypothetical protein